MLMRWKCVENGGVLHNFDQKSDNFCAILCRNGVILGVFRYVGVLGDRVFI